MLPADPRGDLPAMARPGRQKSRCHHVRRAGPLRRAAHRWGQNHLKEERVKVIEIEGQEQLLCKPFPIDVALVRGTVAGEKHGRQRQPVWESRVRKAVFCGMFTMGSEEVADDGRLRITKEGTGKKFVEKVQITFSGG